MSNFTAIDFETATGDRASICQVGLVIVEKCQIVNRIKHLVKPPQNIYSDRCIAIHGIKPEDTENEHSFGYVYDKYLKQYIVGKNVVAHNMAFDMDCLQKALRRDCKQMPKFTAYCTMKIYKSSLDIACNIHGIELNHHDALSDAEACAKLMIRDINRNY